MSRTDRQVQERRCKNNDGRIQIRRKAIDGFHLENLCAHRRNDTPATSGRTHSHRRSAGNLDPDRYFQRIDIAAAEQRHSNNTHGLLGIIGAV